MNLADAYKLINIIGLLINQNTNLDMEDSNSLAMDIIEQLKQKGFLNPSMYNDSETLSSMSAKKTS